MQVEKYFEYGAQVGQKMYFTRYTIEENYFPHESNYPILCSFHWIHAPNHQWVQEIFLNEPHQTQ